VIDPEPAGRVFSVTPMGVEQALAAALDDQEEEVAYSLFDRHDGLIEGVYTVVVEVAVPPGLAKVMALDLGTIGGTFGWYGAAPGWAVRLILGRLAGERLGRRRPDAVVAGALVDWWRIVRAEDEQLILSSVGWFPGDAWLGYCVGQSSLRQVAAFRPRGIPGTLYWKLLGLIHRVAFGRMARHRVRRAAGAL
jgi:hypothetical protein